MQLALVREPHLRGMLEVAYFDVFGFFRATNQGYSDHVDDAAHEGGLGMLRRCIRHYPLLEATHRLCLTG
jgi:hypothetical protein